MKPFLLCFNHNVFTPKYLKERDPDVAKVLYQWAKISGLPTNSLHIVLTGAGTAFVYHRNIEGEVCPVFVMTCDPSMKVEVLAEIMDGNRKLIDPTVLLDNKEYISVYCNDEYTKVKEHSLLHQFIHAELRHKCRHTPQETLRDSIKERLSNFGIKLCPQAKFFDNKGSLVVIDKEQGFVLLNLASYFLAEEPLHFLGPDMAPWYPSEIHMPVRYDFIINLRKGFTPDIPQWGPNMKNTKETNAELDRVSFEEHTHKHPDIKHSVSKSTSEVRILTETVSSGIEEREIPKQLLETTIGAHEVPDHVMRQKVVALQNCLYTTKPEVTLETILDGIKARYAAMEQPINVIYAHRVDLFTIKVYGGEGICLLSVVKTKDTNNSKTVITFRDVNFFFEEEKQKIGHWLIDNYYGMY